jgi:hypothetical protein
MIGSISNLELLLHCHYSPDPHPRLHAPSIQEGIEHLLAHGMIDHTTVSQVYKTTEKGKYYIEWLLHVPFPRGVWEMPPLMVKHLKECHHLASETQFDAGTRKDHT